MNILKTTFFKVWISFHTLVLILFVSHAMYFIRKSGKGFLDNHKNR